MAAGPFLLLAVLRLATPADTGGAELHVSYTADAVGVVAGGVDRGADLLDDVDLELGLDGGRLLGVPGLSAFVYGLGNQGGHPSGRAGDLQTLDDIQAPTSWRIYEAWVQQFLAGDRLSVLGGLYDVNSEFEAVPAADVFVNSSFGIEAAFGLSGANGPSIFPVTSLAFRVRALASDHVRVQAVVADGVPGDPADPGGTHVHPGGGDGALVVAQVGYLRPVAGEVGGGPSPPEVRRRRAGRTAEAAPHDLAVSVGVWRYTGRSRGTGAYVTGEKRLLGDGEGRRPELWAFVRAGIASERASAASASAVAGLSGTGVLPGRPEDRAGIGVAAARRSPALPAAAASGEPFPAWEVALEAVYRARLAPWLALGPDVQLILDPAAEPSASDALVLGLRVELGI